MSKQLTQLTQWVQDTLGDDDITLKCIAGDASARCYYRVQHGSSTLVLMDSSKEKDQLSDFIKIAELFSKSCIHVPDIVVADKLAGCALLSDLGPTTYLSALTPDNADVLYQNALDTLVQFQSSSLLDGNNLNQFDENTIKTELSRFKEWFLLKLLDLSDVGIIDAAIEDATGYFNEHLLAQPQVLVHRDYHSRNLMVMPGNTVGVLDFQDAEIGPVTYDLGSLLKDCYIKWPKERVANWVAYYLKIAKEKDMLKGINDKTFYRWFECAGVERHLKVLGVFARLNIRDNKPNYLSDIPRIVSYVVDALEGIRELSALKALFIDVIVPKVQRFEGSSL